MDPFFKKVAEVSAKAAAGAASGAAGGAVVGTVGGPVGAAVVGVVGGVGGGLLGALWGIASLFNDQPTSDECWLAVWENANMKLKQIQKEMCGDTKQSGSYPQETRAMKTSDDYKEAIRSGAEIMSCGRVGTIGEASEPLRRQFFELPTQATAGTDTQQPGGSAQRIEMNSRPDVSTTTAVQNVHTICNDKLCPMTEEAELIGLATLANKVIQKNPKSFFSFLKESCSAEKTTVAGIFRGKSSNVTGIDKKISDAIKNIVEVISYKSSKLPTNPSTTPALIHTSDHSWEHLRHILPVLITSRSFFLIMMSCAEIHDGNNQNQDDSITSEEDVCHCITSVIDALSEKAKELFDKLQKGGVTSVSGSIYICPYPRIVVVGTYTSSEQHTKIQSMVENIRKWVNMNCSESVQHNFKAIIVNASDKSDVNVLDIKKRMTDFITSDLKIQTPLSWELFRQIFSYLTKNIPIIRLEKVATIASFCDIKKDFPSVLNFYHEHGAFLYYPDVQYLNNIIIIDPKWLQEKLHMVLTPKVDQSSPIWRWYKKGILIAPHCENPEKIEKLQDGLMMLLEKYRLAAPIHINQEICDLKGPKYFVPFLLKSKRTTPPCKMTSKLHTASLHFIFPEVKHLPTGVFTNLSVALAINKQFKMDFESEMSSDQITYWFGKYDKVILSASLTSICVVVERLKYCGDDYPASNFGSTCQKIFMFLATEIQKLFKTSCPAFCCECSHKALSHYVKISTVTENTCDTLRCDEMKPYTLKDCEQLWLKMAAPTHTVGKVFKREIHNLGLQPEDLVKVTRALEITPIDPDTDSKLLIRWWSEAMGADARKHLLYHLKRLGMTKAAQAIDRGIYCGEVGR